jgi:hypothetical protein
MRTTLVILFLASMVAMAASIPAVVHHGTSTYEMDKELQLTGTVKEWTFNNPHSWLWLNATAPKKEEWSIESAPPSYLSPRGWSTFTLKAGEKLTVLVSPLKGEPRRAILLEVKRPSGETLVVRPRGSFGRPASLPGTNSPR